MKHHELTVTPVDQRDVLLQEQQVELERLRFKTRQGQHKQVRQLREIRKTIARLLTLRRGEPKA